MLSVTDRKHKRSKGRMMVENKGEFSSHPRLIDYFDLSTPFTAFSQKHPSFSSQVWGILRSQGWALYEHLFGCDHFFVNLKPLWRLTCFGDVKGFRTQDSRLKSEPTKFWVLGVTPIRAVLKSFGAGTRQRSSPVLPSLNWSLKSLTCHISNQVLGEQSGLPSAKYSFDWHELVVSRTSTSPTKPCRTKPDFEFLPSTVA